MAQSVERRTIHTITIDLEDQVMASIELGDEVEVILRARGGDTRPRKLTYQDIDRLTSDGAGFSRKTVR